MANQTSPSCSHRNTVKSSSSIPSNNSNGSEIIKKIETKKSPLRVRFHRKVKVKSTIHLKHYTNQEIEACWYTPVEYNNILKGLYLTLDLMKISLSPYDTLFSGSFDNSSSTTSSNDKEDKTSSLSSLYCSRGLENLSIEGGLKYSTRTRRQNAIWSVLDEQYKQYQEAILQQQRTMIYDVVKIGNIYKCHTQTSQMNARAMGRIDAEEEPPSSSPLSSPSSSSPSEDDDLSVSSYSSFETTMAASTTLSSSSPISIITYDGKVNSSDNKKNHLSYRRGGARRKRWSFVNTRVHSCIPQCA
jgi:hypothetical protein